VSEENEERKYCPMPSSEAGVVIAYCVKEKCAWWNADMQACSIAALGRMATYWMLNDSHDRMTPAERRGLRPEGAQ